MLEEMIMSVHKPWSHCSALKINELGGWPYETTHFRLISHRDNLSVFYGYGVDDLVVFIHGDDGTVLND
jgi:hypothetical protein